MPLQNYYELIMGRWKRERMMDQGEKEGQKFYIFNYKEMVIRHYLAAEKEDEKTTLSNKTQANDSPPASTQSSAAPPAPTQSEPPNPQSSILESSQAPSTETSNTATQESTPDQTKSAANNMPTTSPSPLDSEPAPTPSPPTQAKTQPSPTPSSASSTSTAETAASPQSTTSNTSKNQQTVIPVSIESAPPKQQSTVSASSSSPAPAKQPVKSLTSAHPAANTTSSSESTFLGISTSLLLHVGVAILVIAIIVIIIIILYRRYRTRLDYNQSPQNFAHKPELGFNEEYYLSHNKVEKCLTPEKIVIQQQNLLNGKIYQVEFKGTEKSAVYFHRRQVTTAYFEIEVLQANSSVQIGFIPISSFPKLKNGQESVGSAGVGVTNNGFVMAEGENIYNYSWSLAFGDVFGLGITRESSKFSERRAWISKNGVLLNFPPNDEMDKWLATIEISAEEKAQYNIGVEKNEEQEKQEEEDQAKAKEKAQRQKIEALLKRQRISLKTFNKFEYYPVIVCHGNEHDDKSTVINVNVGGQIFRMYDTQFRSGLLKDKALFGDD